MCQRVAGATARLGVRVNANDERGCAWGGCALRFAGVLRGREAQPGLLGGLEKGQMVRGYKFTTTAKLWSSLLGRPPDAAGCVAERSRFGRQAL